MGVKRSLRLWLDCSPRCHKHQGLLQAGRGGTSAGRSTCSTRSSHRGTPHLGPGGKLSPQSSKESLSLPSTQDTVTHGTFRHTCVWSLSFTRVGSFTHQYAGWTVPWPTEYPKATQRRCSWRGHGRGVNGVKRKLGRWSFMVNTAFSNRNPGTESPRFKSYLCHFQAI